MKIKINANVINIQKQYKKILKQSYLVDQKYEKALKKAGCFSCTTYYDDKKMLFEKRHKNCSKCKYMSDVSLAYFECLTSKKELEKCYDKYVLEIYNFLKSVNPSILNGKTKKVISFDNFFPNSFSALNKSQKSILINLIEGEGIDKIV